MDSLNNGMNFDPKIGFNDDLKKYKNVFKHCYYLIYYSTHTINLHYGMIESEIFNSLLMNTAYKQELIYIYLGSKWKIY